MVHWLYTHSGNTRFSFNKKNKNKKVTAELQRMSGPQMLTIGCRLAGLSLRCHVRGAGRGWERCPSQPRTAAFRRGERKLTFAELDSVQVKPRHWPWPPKPLDTPSSCLSLHPLLSLTAAHAQDAPISSLHLWQCGSFFVWRVPLLKESFLDLKSSKLLFFLITLP